MCINYDIIIVGGSSLKKEKKPKRKYLILSRSLIFCCLQDTENTVEENTVQTMKHYHTHMHKHIITNCGEE